MALIRLKDVVKCYHMGDQTVKALDHVTFSVNSGDFIAIMGSSGSGKSSLLNVLGLLDVPDSGEYEFTNKQVSKMSPSELAKLRRQTLGFVFQQFHLLPRISAWENVALPLLYSERELNFDKAKEQLTRVGLLDRLDHRPNQMSGGQQQRVAIARALINNPTLILADEPTGNLDSATSKEIMEMLTELNRQGITIIMVTHEDDIAQYARRRVRMKDGRIIEDVANGSTPVGDQVQRGGSLNSQGTLGLRGLLSYFRQGFRALLANKVRTALSMLGIMIGVAAVIAMLALGKGANSAIQESLSSLGSNLLILRTGAVRHGGVAYEAGATTRMTVEDAQGIASVVPNIREVAPQVTGKGQVTYNGKNWSTYLTGTTANYQEMRASRPVLGRFFTEAENQSRKMVAVLGQTVVTELFGDKNPVGEYIKINRINFQVIGVLPSKGGMSWRDQDDVIIVPLNTAMKRLLGKDYVESIEIEVVSPDAMGQAQDDIMKYMVRRHRIPSAQEQNAFQIRNMADIQSAMSESSQTMSLLLAAIAAISLLVGGIGIMNIMLVAVTERTREIGLRKAVGATARDILMQFLVESVVVSVVGGAIGILVGWLISVTISSLTSWSTSLDLLAAFGAVGFSMLIGITFGLYPARRAALLNPIEALRYD